ncbi:uncharacterized protein CIMG_13733 [Coccidioides immitis RS]|uniref:Uncharacterized protein n=1 Tax=Coccidioides immitis (strain RS) TaxID=246410 RepID=A0A0D8JWM9_COCIM|nr:uncharacterized protein CIMG_13733 [Coccidioides immitis RS]KJF61544.1 hypothetical protein CIMG_13733 [Coccidioides immitis RS]
MLLKLMTQFGDSGIEYPATTARIIGVGGQGCRASRSNPSNRFSQSNRETSCAAEFTDNFPYLPVKHVYGA